MKLLILFLGLFSMFTRADVDLNKVSAALKTTGIKVEIHGSSTDSKLFVATYRNPDNFFENAQFPLVTEDAKIMEQIRNTKRHQYFLIKGDFLDNKAPIKHIGVTSMELVKDYASELDHMPYTYKGDVMDLLKMTEFTGRVHAVGNDGKMLVMEYKDRIMPVVVMEPATVEFAKNLYRGDLIKIKFNVRGEPETPTHLSVRKQSQLGTNEKPIEVIESLVAHHGEPITKSGVLVKFPKSPQINFNIYALLVEDSVGSSIQFTLTNLEKPEVFMKVREKLENFWNANAGTIENDRNKMINRKIIVTAKGTYNMIDRGQANPQIIIENPDDISFELK